MRYMLRHAWVLLTFILSLWLVNGFLTVSLSMQLLLSLLILLTAGGLLWRQWQRRPSAGEVHGQLADDVLPPDTFTGAVILVAGDIPQTSLLPLPDVLLNSLSRHRGVSRRMQHWRIAGLISSVFLLLAMTCSFVNNQHLIRTLSDHLMLYARLGEQSTGPRLQAQATLRNYLQQLNDRQRRGVPQRYGLGLYQGMRLIAPVNAAVNGWTPEVSTVKQPVVKATPSTVRLDSLSLFDTASATLKSGSTRVLVNALVGIKAKPGWLIVVSGHTDNTGNAPLNQTLSLKRAEAVRDWMRDTGGVPESCFAVQGYGATRPLQANDTTAGRAANRRVEISLVPQADAGRKPCVITG